MVALALLELLIKSFARPPNRVEHGPEREHDGSPHRLAEGYDGPRARQDRVEAGSGHDLYADGGDTPAPQAAETETGPASDPWERRRDGRPSIMSRLTLAPRHEDVPDDALKLHDGVSTETREITIAASQPAWVSVVLAPVSSV